MTFIAWLLIKKQRFISPLYAKGYSVCSDLSTRTRKWTLKSVFAVRSLLSLMPGAGCSWEHSGWVGLESTQTSCQSQTWSETDGKWWVSMTEEKSHHFEYKIWKCWPKWSASTVTFSSPVNASFISGEEDWWRGVRRDLRGSGSAEPGHSCLEGGVCSTTQTGAEDGGGCAEEATGWVFSATV